MNDKDCVRDGSVGSEAIIRALIADEGKPGEQAIRLEELLEAAKSLQLWGDHFIQTWDDDECERVQDVLP